MNRQQFLALVIGSPLAILFGKHAQQIDDVLTLDHVLQTVYGPMIAKRTHPDWANWERGIF